MKYTNLWLPGYLYINDYVTAIEDENVCQPGEKLAHDLWHTLPYLDQIQSEELTPYWEALRQFSREVIVAIKDDESEKAAENAQKLREVFNTLRKKATDYLLDHKESITQEDPFLAEFYRYFSHYLDFLTTEEKFEIMKEYVDLHLEEKLFLLAYELKDRPFLGDLSLQKARDHIEINILKVDFLREVFERVLQSLSYQAFLAEELKKDFLAFCQFLAKEGFNLKYEPYGLEIKMNETLETNLEDFVLIEKYKNVLRVAQLKYSLLMEQGNIQHRFASDLAAIEEKKKKINEKITKYQDKLKALDAKLNTRMIHLYYEVIYFEQEETFEEAAKVWGLSLAELKAPIVTGESYRVFNFLANGMSSLKPFLDILKLGASLGAVGFVGLGVVGAVAGVGLGTAAVLGKNKLTQAKVRMGEILDFKKLRAAWYGDFSAKYQQPDFQVNGSLLNLCEQDENRAKILNGFYVKNLLNIEVRLKEGEKNGIDTKVENKIKTQLEESYQAIRKVAGEKNKKVFWSKRLPQDVKSLLSVHYQTYFARVMHYVRTFHQRYLYEKQLAGNANINVHSDSSSTATANDSGMVKTNQPEHPVSASLSAQVMTAQRKENLHIAVRKNQGKIDFFSYALKGVMQDVDVLMAMGECFAKEDLSKARENHTRMFRALVKLPLNYRFEEHVDLIISRNSFSLFLIWLKEKCFNPGSPYTKQEVKSLLAQPLAHFDHKTFWHLLCDLPFGHELLTHIVELPELEEEANLAQKCVRKVADVFKNWCFVDYCDLLATYRGENPLEHAMQRGNIKLLRVYLENLIKSKRGLTSKEIRVIFNTFFHQSPLAKTFCEKFSTEFGKISPKSYWSKMLKWVTHWFDDNPLLVEMIAALMIKVAKGEEIPSTEKAITDFFLELREETSCYVHIKWFKDLSTTVLTQLGHQVNAALSQKTPSSLISLQWFLGAQQGERHSQENQQQENQVSVSLTVPQQKEIVPAFLQVTVTASSQVVVEGSPLVKKRQRSSLPTSIM